VEWPFDSHACHRYDPEHPGTREGYTFVEHAIFQIPYGVVVPKNVDGLLVPVACSATHIAYNGLRMEPVFMILGEACGQAAHLAIQNSVPARAVPLPHLQKHLLENGGAITYLDDLHRQDDAFVACQWLGARGLNDGYQAEPTNTLTRAQGATRLRRVLESMMYRWGGPGESQSEGPLQVADVMAWLRSAGFSHPERNQPDRLLRDSAGGIAVGQFAQLIYGVLGPVA
jgi:FAD dependent oxidoreductase